MRLTRGYGLMGAIESFSDEQILKEVNTNKVRADLKTFVTLCSAPRGNILF
jgi:hypothetical protein